MHVFRNAWFARFAKRVQLSDEQLLDAVKRAERGLIDADLGGSVIKQRIARPGEGRSGGFRSVILYRRGDRAFFIYGFAKSCNDNLRPGELDQFRKLAQHVLNMSDSDLERALAHGVFEKVV